MKYLAPAGILLCIGMIISCFLPWTYHADINKTFTGFFSENNIYGRPGRYFVFFSLFCLTSFLLKNNILLRVQFFVAGIMMAYAVKTYILFVSCYRAYCPEKKEGIYLMIVFSILIFIASSMASVAARVQDDKEDAPTNDHSTAR